MSVMPKMKWNGLVPAAVAAGVLGWIGLGAGGCELIASVDRSKINQATGGAGGVGGTGGNVGGNTGGGGNPACVESECAATTTPTDCKASTCVDDACVEQNAAARATCDDGVDVNATLCDGMGNCVECVDATDCTGEDLCDNGNCIAPGCTDHELNNGETSIGTGPGTGDGNGNDCGGLNCAPCVENEGCNETTDCLSFVCDTSGAGGAGGGGGNGGAGGGIVINGVCTVCAANPDCPSDRWCDTGTAPERCAMDKAAGAANACGDDAECADNMNCVDGFCCDTGCGSTCQFCGTSGTEGVCTLVAAGMDPGNDCTASATACTTANCSGTTTACGNPGAGTVCRASAGNPNGGNVCDQPEECTGVPGAACPANVFSGAGVVCRTGSGNPNGGSVCDPNEFCPGTAGGVCPVDSVSSGSTTCRTAAGNCDIAEMCPGVAGGACGVDVLVAAGENAAPSFGDCATGCCDGAGPSTPANCGTGNCITGEQCDADEDCTATCDVGTTNLCL